MKSMHVLVFSYYWPPAGGPGVQRWVKMCNHLIEAGVKVTVITVKNGSYPALDPSLERELHTDIQVIKTKTLEPFGLFNLLQGKKGKGSSVGMIGLDSKASLFKRISIWIRANYLVPDARKFWKSYAVRAAEQVIAKEDISHLITTGPPHSTHAIGLALKKRHRLSWMADLRDPWVNIHYHDVFPLTENTRQKHQRLEDEVLDMADHVSVVSPGMEREFRNRAQGISVIYNGYDELDLQTAPLTEKRKFTIRYIGNLKPNQEVNAFNEALSSCISELDGFKEDVRVQLVGNKDAGLLARMREGERAPLIESIDPVDHSEAVGHMKGANLLLFIVPKAKNNRLIITGKLFEYLASGTPLLAIGPQDGDAAQIIREAIGTEMHDYQSKEDIARQLRAHYQKWKSGEDIEVSDSKIEAYSRKAQTEKVIEILRRIA